MMMELDLTDAIEVAATESWRCANGDMPIRDCDAWQECLREAKLIVDAVVPIAERLIFRSLKTRIEDLEHDLRLARRHLDVCPTASQVSDHDSDKARENQ